MWVHSCSPQVYATLHPEDGGEDDVRLPSSQEAAMLKSPWPPTSLNISILWATKMPRTHHRQETTGETFWTNNPEGRGKLTFGSSVCHGAAHLRGTGGCAGTCYRGCRGRSNVGRARSSSQRQFFCNSAPMRGFETHPLFFLEVRSWASRYQCFL